MLALKRPSAASFACWTRSAISDVSSRKITTPPSAAAAERREVRLNVGAVRRAERHLRAIDVAAAAPAPQLAGELGRDRREIELAGPSRGAELLDGGLVDQANLVVTVDDDDALAQVLDDVLVELDEVAQVDAALLGERLGLNESRAQQLHDGSDDEDDGAEDADGRELRAPS